MSDLPADLAYGKVVGRFLLATGDGPDVNNVPDATAPTGLKVTIAPKTTVMRTTAPSALVVPRPVVCEINSAGDLLDPNGQVGVWLVTGFYTVTYTSNDQFTLPSHVIEVTSAHTVGAPLDIAQAMPVVAPITVGQYTELDTRLKLLEAGGGSAYTSLSVPNVQTYAATRDTSIDMALTANATFSLTGTKVGVIVGIRVDPNGFTLTLPGGTTVTGSDPVTVTAWRMTEGWVYGIAGAAVAEPPDPGDVTAPTAGTLTSSAITESGFTLSVTGASDETALHAQPYSFSVDGGTTWSPWQTSPEFLVTGRAASTAYNCRHQVRDNADPYHSTLGTAITVTTAAVAGVLTYRGESRAAANGESHSYLGVDVGAASASRYIIIACTWWASGARTANVTVNGVAATQVYAPAPISGSGSRWFIAPLPTGATADIVATTTAAGQTLSPSIAVWTASQQVSFVAGRVESPAAVSGDTTESLTVASIAGGFALAAFRTVSSAVTTVWTGITERWDSGTAQPTSGGDMATTGASTTVTATFTPALTGNLQAALVAFKWGAP